MDLHGQSIVKYPGSSILEVLETAYGRFADIGLCDTLKLNTKNGDKLVILKHKQGLMSPK